MELKQEIQNKMKNEFKDLNDVERNDEIVKGLKTNPLFERLLGTQTERHISKKEAA